MSSDGAMRTQMSLDVGVWQWMVYMSVYGAMRTKISIDVGVW